MPRYGGAAVLVLAAACLLRTAPTVAQHGTDRGEWRYYAGDAGSTKYSPLDQITRENVKDLRIAWRWKGQNFGPAPEFNLEATPLMVGGVLYTTIGTRRDVVAIDAATGETLWMWRYDEGSRGQGFLGTMVVEPAVRMADTSRGAAMICPLSAISAAK